MDSNKKYDGSLTPLTPMVATLAAALSSGCADHRLPPNPVPNADLRRPVPGWFDPNAKWNPNGNDTRVYVEGKVVFQTDKAILRPESEKVLDQLLKFLQEHPEVTRLRVEGHTDSTASDEYNQELSAKRSLAVCDWLVDKGVDHIRLVAVGFGESKPRAPNELVNGRAENRRTEFHVMEVGGRPFGPMNALDGGMVLTVLTAEERERLKHPPKVAPPVGSAFVATGNEIKPYKAPPKKAFDEDDEVVPAYGKPAGDAGAVKKDEKKDDKKGAPPAPGTAAPQ